MATNQPITIPYEDGDELVHTETHPFCDDSTCPCHQDHALMEEYIYAPINDGTLTVTEAVNICWNRQVAP